MAWDSIWNGIKDIDFEHGSVMWEYYRMLLGNFSLSGRKVIEFGCGTGINSILMAKLGAKVTFLDESKSSLEIVKRTLDRFSLTGELIHGSVFDFNTGKSFDLCHSEGLVEHFIGEKRQEIVNIHANAVKKNGKVVLIVPHQANPFYRVGKLMAEKTNTWVYGNEYPYTANELRFRMGRAGIEIEKMMGGEMFISALWLLAPLVLNSRTLLKKALNFHGSKSIMRLNYGNFLANKYGRLIGAVGRKI
jgi:cyclopropane fatty-acyl-phospholipid synthase-like methyltransferase